MAENPLRRSWNGNPCVAPIRQLPRNIGVSRRCGAANNQ